MLKQTNEILKCWETKNFPVNLWAELRHDPLIESHRKWLECVLLPLGMKVVYSHVQFRFWVNEIFKSEVSLIQLLKGTKISQKTLAPHWTWCEKLRSLNIKSWEQSVCTLDTWSFRASRETELLSESVFLRHKFFSPPPFSYSEYSSINWFGSSVSSWDINSSLPLLLLIVNIHP